MDNNQISSEIISKGKGVIKANNITTKLQGSRHVILMLAVISALQMISFGIIMPIFPRRLGEFGSGVEALGLMAMAYSMTSIAAAPFMGSLADRYGRRPLLLGSLAAYVVAFTGYLLATSTGSFIVIRALAGAMTAGLGPAAMGIVSDIAPENERARWIGIVGGGSSVGWIIGPPLGGFLYDKWGYGAPFIVAVTMAVIALIAAMKLVPETRTRKASSKDPRKQSASGRIRPVRQMKSGVLAKSILLWKTLPRPLPQFAVLLFVGFIMIFAWTFAEPQFMFYIYDDLGWTSTRFGLAMSGYGVASLVGQILLGRSSDKFGRVSIIVVGLLLHSGQYIGMMLTTSYLLIALAYIVAGLGEALISPALGAFFLDITPEQHKSRVMGIKGSVGSLGSILGPLLAVAASGSLSPQGVFLISGALLVSATILVLFALRNQGQVANESDIEATGVAFQPVTST